MRQVKPHRPRHADASAELRRRAEYVLHESTTSAGSPPAAGDGYSHVVMQFAENDVYGPRMMPVPTKYSIGAS